jgi:hypothetical protein
MRLMTALRFRVIFTAAMVLAVSANVGNILAAEKADSGAQAKSSMPLPLKVKGTKVINSKDEAVTLRGVNAASLEWTSDGDGHILETVRVAIDDWKVNCIRLPLSQDRWFGKAPEQNDVCEPYRALVKEVVDLCGSKGCYIILDLHWSNAGQAWGTNIGQHSMPDKGSVKFWKDFAPVYANHPAVLFDLYNEPHDVSWDVWLKGGTITDRPNGPGLKAVKYEAAGMQELLDTVRATGAKNVVIAGGLEWAYDFSGILDGRQLKDPDGNGVIYANHAYDNKRESVFKWIGDMEKATAVFPVIVSEFGGSGGPNRRRGWWGSSPANAMGDDWLLHVLQAIQDHNWPFTVWDLHPTAGPTLIADWNYMPTPDFGVYVKKLLIEGKLPKYTPPDLTKLAKGPATTLPETARLGGKELYGDWHLEPEQGERGGSILAFSGGDEGKLVGQWIDFRGLSELEDVRFKNNKVSFSQSVRFGGDEYKAHFAGTIEGDKLSGTFTHGWVQDKIEGSRSKEMPAEGVRAGSALIGNWNLDVTGERGGTKQRLKVNPDMSGMYGISPIEKVNLEGNKVSFKIVMEFRQRTFEMNFTGKLEGPRIVGEISTFRGTQKVVGKKASRI